MLVKERISRIDTKDTPIFFHETPLPKHEFHNLNLIFEFTDFSPLILEKSVNMKWPDFEDAVQSATAEAIHADYIVTRNIKDFVEKQGCCIYTGRIVGKIIKILIK